MSAMRLAVVYADAAEGHAVVVDVGGGQVSVGSPGRFASGKPLSVSVAALDHSTVVRVPAELLACLWSPSVNHTGFSVFQCLLSAMACSLPPSVQALYKRPLSHTVRESNC
jgi:hypothetical protein